MARRTVEFRVVTTDNGFIVEGGGKTMVAKNEETEIGEAVQAILKGAGDAKKPKVKRTRRTKEEIAAAKTAAGG